ncbi:MAG: sulfite exporter TauE/SafE family protein, partial [Gammaproteobacteria bacterium]
LKPQFQPLVQPTSASARMSIYAFVGIIMFSTMTAPLGAKLAHKLPARQLKRYFSIVVFTIAAKLIWL